MGTKKSKKISAITSEVITENIKNENVKIKYRIGVEGVMELANFIARSCYDAETREYFPEMTDYVTRIGVIRYYTNIQLPDDPELRYDIVYDDNIYDYVIRNIDINELHRTTAAAEKKIEFSIKEYENYIVGRVNELFSSLDAIKEQFNSVISGISPEDITKLVSVLSGENYSEESLARAVLKAQNDIKSEHE